MSSKKTVNTDIFDRMVSNMANGRAYEEGLQVQNRRIIRRHRSRLGKLLRGNIKADVKPEVIRYGKELNSHLSSSMLEFSTAELDFQTNNLNKSIGKWYKVKRPKSKELVASLDSNHIKGKTSILGNVGNISKGELMRIQGKVRRGLAEGKGKDSIIKEVMKTTRLTEAQASTLTRTSLTATQTAATMKVMNDNSEVIKGYIFTAILDSRTTPICSHHNGKEYPLSNTAYLPPLHFNCRSTTVPVVADFDTVMALNTSNINKDKLKKVDPFKLNGKAAKRQSFGTWLKNQAYDVQKSILGDDFRTNMFREGKLKFERFTTAKGKKFSIQALRKKATEMTQVFLPRQRVRSLVDDIPVKSPNSLLRNPKHEQALRSMFLHDSDDMGKTMSLTDYKGTSLTGKAASKRRVGNMFDERNFSADPLTGEIKNNLIYDPDTKLFQERIDFMRSSKLIPPQQKDLIERVAVSLDDKISVNQQTVVVDNLRVVMERYAKDKKPWKDFPAVVRAENRFAVQNVSRMLDVRSRKRSEMFVKYLSSGKDMPKVQILGKYYGVDDLSKMQLKDQRYIDNWRSTVGSELAREVYYKGRAPARTYFNNFVKKYPTKEKFLKKLGKDGKFHKKYKSFKSLFNREPSDSWISKTYARGRESYRNIVDLEFLRISKKPSAIGMDDGAVNSLSKISKLIGSGQTTDYDLLAMKIGQKLSDDFPNINPLSKTTLRDNHREGSKILKMFEDKGMIKVNFRGKTRRGVLDLDTGRMGGAWQDTVSREVTVIDKRLIKLQEAERRVLISRRLGNVSDRDRVYAKAGHKTYFDARGKDTGLPMISADKFPDYDPRQIDRDIAKTLNQAMNTEYKVDKEFFGFMDDVVRFRDPRGNSEYYDNINMFRQEILARGEQGYGMMSTAKYHAKRGKNFKTYAFLDSRGRVYHRGYLTPTGGEMTRPFLNSGQKVAFSKDALKELKIQTGSLIGPGSEALTTAGRLDIFRRNEAEILKLGRLLQSPTQRDRRIREFLKHPLIAPHGGAEVPKMARLALEYARVYDHTAGNLNDASKLKTYMTRLMIENDASASGAQIIALSTKNKSLGTVSNVVPTTQKNRLYDLVAMDTVNDPDFLKIKSLRDANLTWEELSKAAKGQNMVTFYGAGDATKAANVYYSPATGGMKNVLDKKGYFSISKKGLSEQLRLVDQKIKLSDKIGASSVVDDLKSFRGELLEMVNNDVPMGKKMMNYASEIHPDSARFVEQMFSARKGIVGPKDFEEVSRIMTKNLSRRAPVTDNFIVFWKKAAKEYVKDTQNVDIPWVTFDGKTMMQRYRPKLQERIEFTDPITGRKVANIYEAAAKDGKLAGKSSIQDAAIGLGVNGNHSNDAVIVRKFHQWGADNNVGTATIHDAFFTNIGHAEAAKNQLRTIYADALEGDTIVNTLKAMRREGMSKAKYQELYKEAEKLGLINVKDPLTREEILEPLKPGYELYGIGP